MNISPTKLVLRIGQIGDVAEPIKPPEGHVLYRLVDGQMSICARHLAELAAYQPLREARAVLTADQIDSLVAEFGLRRDDLMAAHGPWDPIFGVEKCRMCESVFAEGNICYADDCKRALHPQWPAVYCCSACAWGDA